MRRARLVAVVPWIALAGCNSILGNRDFRGPDPDAGVEDRCTPRGLPRTTVTGTVFAPGGTLPLYHAMVYAPTAPLADIPDGAYGPACASGAPVATTFTDSRGKFKLEGVPAGAGVSIVIQVGKWRRVVPVPDLPECSVMALAPDATRLPRDRSEGHIPHIAIAAGQADNLECIAHDLGIADSEITTGSTSTGRVRLYTTNGSSALASGGSIESAATLLAPDVIQPYDAVMFGCQGTGAVMSPGDGQVMFDFANRGGLVWLTHYGYQWLQAAPDPWKTIGTFRSDTTDLPPTLLVIDQSSPRGQAFADWAVGVGASLVRGTIPTTNAIGSCRSVDPSITQRVLTLDPASGTDVEMFTWDAAMGGRLVFSDVHRAIVRPASGVFTSPYPTECTDPAPQDLAILFEMFDAPGCTR
jgi:hypothetical protein